MATNLSIQTILGDVAGSTGHRYDAKDSAGNRMDTVKIITNPAGGYLAVYHTGNRVHLASSTDLLNWTFRRTLDPEASQPTICALPTGGFLTAAEFNNRRPAAWSGSGTTRTWRRCSPALPTGSGRFPGRCPRATRAPRTSTRCR